MKSNTLNNPILIEDMQSILTHLTEQEKNKFKDAVILITGCGGFLGFYFMYFFATQSQSLGIKKVIGLDNFMLGKPKWLESLILAYPQIFEIQKFDIIKDQIKDISSASTANLIIHAASIASPTFYRKYPIETLDANIWGLRNLLEYYKDKAIKGFLFFSSSEIYGDPTKDHIPTHEEYRGNVSCIGPRACYDESKRFGETICYLFAQKYNLPITIARPFNNYGPGKNLEDKRVPADFAKSILNQEDIVILSNGKPTRTFCYISDAIAGYLKVLLYGEFDYFNIGMDQPEISISQLAQIYEECGKKHFNYTKKIIYSSSQDKDYLTHNPNRRCPDISKARQKLHFNPKILISEGVERFLFFLKKENNEF